MLIIDRFENGYAICEEDGERYIRIPCSDISEDAGEGSVLVEKDGVFCADRALTEELSRKSEEKLNKLMKSFDFFHSKNIE